MFIFLHLILAHLIGDFPLQFNSIYALKFKGLKGLSVHVLIVFTCLVLMCWPYLEIPAMQGFLIFLGLSHLLQDWAKIKFTQNSKHQIFYYALDQAFHIGFIALVFLTPLKDLNPPEASTFLIELYNSNRVTLWLIAFLMASYNGHFMIMLINSDYLKKQCTYSNHEKWYGFIERALIVSLFFCKLPLTVTVALIAVIMLVRSIYGHLLNKSASISPNFSSLSEIFLSGAIGTLTGFIILLLI